MNKNDPRIEEIFKKADELKKSGGQEYEKLIDAIKKKVASMKDGVKISKFYKEFTDQLKIERAKTQNINEGLGDALRKMTLGAMLATCIANPAYAKVIVDNQHKMLKSFSNMARQIAGDNIELQANLWEIEKNTKLDNII